MKRKINGIFLSMSFLFLLLLPGCRYFCWMKEIFYQGECVDTYLDVVRQYLRAVHVYDQLSPLAHFDVIWLSDEVRIAYSQVYAKKHCLSEERFHSFVRRQLEENKRYISFYVLSAVKAQYGSELLDDCNAEWSVILDSNCVCYKPVEIKEVDLCPEFILFFGPSYTRFKRSYLVRYDAMDINRNFILNGTNAVVLHFNRIDRRAKMVWCLDSKGYVIRQSLDHPNVLAYPLHCP